MLFYPSHDIALSNGVKHFNPPAAALRLQEDLASLSDIWNEPYRQAIAEGRTTDDQGFPLYPLPWGWDWDTRRYLHQEYHIPMKYLPSDADLEKIRLLSSREQTIPLLKALGYKGELPQCIHDDEELDSFFDAVSEGHKYVMKTPWSSSGRGLIKVDTSNLDVVRKRALSVINKMGCIVAENWLENKRQDFAMLFFADREHVSFLGYSLFDNYSNGTYRFGYLLSNDEMEKRICNDIIDKTYLDDLHDRITDYFEHLFNETFRTSPSPFPLGYFGIDMMTLDSMETPVMPCVEINFRVTMGTVSRRYFDHHMHPGQEGRFYISPLQEDGHFRYKFDIQ